MLPSPHCFVVALPAPDQIDSTLVAKYMGVVRLRVLLFGSLADQFFQLHDIREQNAGLFLSGALHLLSLVELIPAGRRVQLVAMVVEMQS